MEVTTEIIRKESLEVLRTTISELAKKGNNITSEEIIDDITAVTYLLIKELINISEANKILKIDSISIEMSTHNFEHKFVTISSCSDEFNHEQINIVIES